MKIDNTSSVNMLHKGVMENSEKLLRGQETERKQAALETKQTVSSFIDTKGAYFDSKA